MGDSHCKVSRLRMAFFGRRWFLNSLLATGALVIIALYFGYALAHAPFQAISPDSARFMRFWQAAADQYHRSGGGAKQAALAVASAVVAYDNLDVHRGRFLQCAAYGLDGLTRGFLPSSGLNLWMMLLLMLNAGLISWVALCQGRASGQRIGLFCLGAAVVATTVLFVSPAMVLILYAKYLWLPFVLLFFAVRGPLLRTGCLAAASYTDEFGLFATMILVGMAVVRYLLTHPELDRWSRPTPIFRILGACVWGALAAMALLFLCYGIPAVILNVGATNFRVLAYCEAQRMAHSVFFDAIHDVLWRAEVLVLGTLVEFRALTALIGIVVAGLLGLGFWRRWRTVVLSPMRLSSRWDHRMRDWLSDPRGHYYTFWGVLLLMIVVVLLPRQGEDLTPYSYPAAAVLALLLLAVLVDLFSARTVAIVLAVVLGMHVWLAPHAVRLASQKMTTYLLPDGTVTAADLQAINQSVREFKESGRSPTFAACNNGQEIDLSSQWFYTRIGVKDRAPNSNPYFPVQGTVRVLLWPRSLPTAMPDKP